MGKWYLVYLIPAEIGKNPLHTYKVNLSILKSNVFKVKLILLSKLLNIPNGNSTCFLIQRHNGVC